MYTFSSTSSSAGSQTDLFIYPPLANIDGWLGRTVIEKCFNDRGSFTELVRTHDRGQVSINISKPGITKGQHWHDCKNEIFIVVKGRGLIQMRNLKDGEIEEYEVSGDRIQGVWMKPGWTHNICAW